MIGPNAVSHGMIKAALNLAVRNPEREEDIGRGLCEAFDLLIEYLTISLKSLVDNGLPIPDEISVEWVENDDQT